MWWSLGHHSCRSSGVDISNCYTSVGSDDGFYSVKCRRRASVALGTVVAVVAVVVVVIVVVIVITVVTLK